MRALLSAENLSFWRGDREVLCNAGLGLHSGEMVALVGPNGSGKSTLLRVLAGLLSPRLGQVLLDGRPLAQFTPLQRAAMMSYLPQDTYVFWDFTVEDVIELGATVHDSAFRLTARRKGIAPALAEEFELAPLAGRVLNQLSGGERARVMLAAAVASEPRLLLADEPLASLDICHQLNLMGLLRNLRQRCASIIVLHDLNIAARFADRMIVMDGGRTVLDGPAQAVLESERLDEAFRVRFQRLRREDGTVLLPLTDSIRVEHRARDVCRSA